MSGGREGYIRRVSQGIHFIGVRDIAGRGVIISLSDSCLQARSIPAYLLADPSETLMSSSNVTLEAEGGLYNRLELGHCDKLEGQ